jgi:hypothetical protein
MRNFAGAMSIASHSGLAVSASPFKRPRQRELLSVLRNLNFPAGGDQSVLASKLVVQKFPLAQFAAVDFGHCNFTGCDVALG